MKNHPLEIFRYCPKCGSELFEEHNAKSKHCSSCGFTYYQNPCSATAAFILNSKGELLVVRRGKEPAKDTLDLPGGFVDNNESGEQGIIREIKEETGLDIKEVEYLFSIPNIYRYSGMDIHTLDMFYLSISVMLMKVQKYRLPTMQLLAAGFPCDRSMWSVSDFVRYVKACIVS